MVVGYGAFSVATPPKTTTVSTTATVTVTVKETAPTLPSVVVSDQVVAEDTVIIDSVYLDKPGYVVIHLVTKDGKPGAVIGHSSLLTGQNNRVPVNISGYKGEERLIAMLHYDDGDGVYEFPGPDAPVVLEGRIVMTPFAISSY